VVIDLSDEEEGERQEEEEEEGERSQPTQWWLRKWPRQLVRERETTWELSSHCRSRTQLYHTLLHYKFRLLLQIKQRIERDCEAVLSRYRSSASPARRKESGRGAGVDRACLTALHEVVDRLEKDQRFLNVEVKRLESVLRQATTRWGSTKEELHDHDVWSDEELQRDFSLTMGKRKGNASSATSTSAASLSSGDGHRSFGTITAWMQAGNKKQRPLP
jgi:hypothetical protein